MQKPTRPDSPLKATVDQIEEVEVLSTTSAAGPSKANAGDAALEVLGRSDVRREITTEEDRRVRRKIDLWLMPVIVMVYMLQQLDKYVSRRRSFSLTHSTSGRPCPIHLFLVSWRTPVSRRASTKLGGLLTMTQA